MQRVKAAPKALLPWLALLSALATVAVNAAANALPPHERLAWLLGRLTPEGLDPITFD